jgi:hypothetical protein
MQGINPVLLLRRLMMCIFLPALIMNLSDVVSVLAFHNDSSCSCGDCHNIDSLHLKQPSNHIYNLIGTDQSSTCLRCHQREYGAYPGDHYISTPENKMPPGMSPFELTPGGDFGWLKKEYSRKSDDGVTQYDVGERHGHNIIAIDFGYKADSTNATAPWGTYPSSALHCSSCHDPHSRYRRNSNGSISTEGAPIVVSGSYNNSPAPDSISSVSVYRMLGGIHYQPKSLSGSFEFTADPPAAVSPPSYNRSEASTQTRVAYGGGMSEWCLNCHEKYDPKKHHPAGNEIKITPEIVKLYNLYLPGDNASSSYLTLVPFEVGSTDYAYLKELAANDDSQLGGPINANVSCLSCHRAHASGFMYMTRWQNESQFIIQDGMYPGSDNAQSAIARGHSAQETAAAYYNRNVTKFSSYQRSLCNKCHAKD